MAWVQRTVKQLTGIGMPVFQGRSIFFRNYGVMAKRTPVNVVVGAPIPPPPPSVVPDGGEHFHPLIDKKTDEPLNEDGKILKEWHSKYITALQELEKAHKDASWNIPGLNRQRSLRIVR